MFKKNECFHTPKNPSEIGNWIEGLPADQRLAAMTAAGMMNNLAAVHIENLKDLVLCSEPAGELIQIAFDIASGSVHQQVKVVNSEYDEESIIEGLESGKLATTTWFDEGKPSTIDVIATGESIAEIVSQEINGEYEDYR